MTAPIEKISWSAMDRNKSVDRLQQEKFDLIIIGGGITGAGILREAALRGIKTALIDKEDFGFGTSSRSSKMVHGGFRYLSSGEFKLVRESTTERNWLRKHFGHNIRPLKTNVPIYKNGKLSASKIKFGIRLYDFLSNAFSKFKQYDDHHFLTAEQAVHEQPHIDHTDLEMLAQYYDTNVDDGRLTLETIKEAIVLGDCVPVNYIEAQEYELADSQIVGIKVKDKLENKEFTIYGHQFVNATGIWTDELLTQTNRQIIRPTKGVHVVVPQERLGNRDAFGLTSIDDGRAFFVLEREGFSVIGTTDTDYQPDKPGEINHDLDLPYCTKEDCDYLFRTVNTVFPKAHLTYEDIVSTWAGIRPLVMEEGKSESEVSRKHTIIDSPNGLTTICGGKLTTYRIMAEETLFHIIKNKGGFKSPIPKHSLKKGYSKQPFLVYLPKTEWDQYIKDNNPDLDADTLFLLYQQYGRGAIEILNLISNHPEWKKKLLVDHPFIVGEIHYILEHEFAPHLFDVLRRRTEIFMKVKHTRQKEIAIKIANIMAEKYQWSDERKESEISDYISHISRTVWF